MENGALSEVDGCCTYLPGYVTYLARWWWRGRWLSLSTFIGGGRAVPGMQKIIYFVPGTVCIMNSMVLEGREKQSIQK